MAEEIKPVVDAAKPVDTKTAEKPVTDAAKATPEQNPVVDNKTTPVTETKIETKTEQKPAEELKSLLDDASEEEVKLDKDGKPIEEVKSVVPEKYEFKLPEGVTLDEAAIALVTPAFKELGLSNEQAQKLVDLQMTLNKSNEDAYAQSFDQYVENLKVEAKTYFGTKLPEVMRNMARARDMLLPKTADGKEHPLQEKLRISGLANDKDVIELFDKIGRTIGEGRFVQGKQSAPAKGKSGETMEQNQEGVALTDVYSATYKK